MHNSQISPRRLLQDSFIHVKPIYARTLVFFSPNLLFGLLSAEHFSSPSAYFMLSLIYNSLVFPTSTGASIFYTHQRLTRKPVTIPNALQKASEKFLQSILANFLAVLLVLIIPVLLWLLCVFISNSVSGAIFFGLLFLAIAFYVLIRLSFLPYAVMIENKGAMSSISRSWKLTKGMWWLIFWTLFMPVIFLLIPSFFVGVLVYLINPALVEASGIFVVFLTFPVLAVYYIFVFMRLIHLQSLRGKI